MTKVKLLLNWGPHQRGDVVELDDAVALDLLDGGVVRVEKEVTYDEPARPEPPSDIVAVAAEPESDDEDEYIEGDGDALVTVLTDDDGFTVGTVDNT